MPSETASEISAQFAALDPTDGLYATRFVESLLAAAVSANASDVHLQPTAEGLQVRWRIDGVLQAVGVYPLSATTSVVTRLKVLGDLLTYRDDVPQEGRIRDTGLDVEMRLSTFPTLFGEKAVVRLFAASDRMLRLNDLGLPEEIQTELDRLLHERSGAILVCGPAGSGKTTTVYACLRELVAQSTGGRSIVSVEDPIESVIPGVAQSQVNLPAGFDLPTGLRSLMRQDPEVILIGEIRDRITAEIAFQAALTGQLALSTFHAGSAAGAISRLSDMGIEPYILRSGVLAVVCQRLVRRLCECAAPIDDPSELLGIPVKHARRAVGCEACRHTGYRSRMVLAEIFTADKSDLAQAILTRSDSTTLEQLAIQGGMIPCWQRATDAVETGCTSPAEVRRVLGFTHSIKPRMASAERAV